MAFQDDGRRILGGLRSRFSSRRDEQYDDYGDYEEYGEFDEEYQDYDDGYGNYDDGYGEDNPDAGSSYDSYDSYASVTTRTAKSYPESSASNPRLITADDVRASIQAPQYTEPGTSGLQDAPAADSGVASSRSFGRTMIDSSLPPEMTPEGTAAMSADATQRRSAGLTPSFSQTPDTDTYSDADYASNLSGTSDPVMSTREPSGVGFASRTTPSNAYIGKRPLTVIRPVRYEDAETVARALKGGSVVILAMRGTPDTLFSRVLDFSFGVACALNASVECVGTKVFAISGGSALSEAERAELHNQGVL